MKPKYNVALDQILLAALAFAEGAGAEAASALSKAVASDDFNEAVEMLDNTSQEALDEDELDEEEDELDEEVEAAFVAASLKAKKRLKAKASTDVTDLGDGDPAELVDGEEAPEGEGTHNPASMREGENQVKARLARIAHNKKTLATLKKKQK